MSTPDQYSYGTLVGWTTQDLGSKVVIRLQSVTTPTPHSESDVHSAYFMMDKNQAVQLGDCLYELAGQRAPATRKRFWLRRLFGN